ncbi:MAG: hypothetical protein ACPGQL_00620 [Thermoplasmatota archaeon]
MSNLVAGLAAAILVAAGAGTAFVAFAPDDLDPADLEVKNGTLKVPKSACKTGPPRPDTVPERFVVQVIGLDGAHLSPTLIRALDESLDHSFWFLDFTVTTSPTAAADDDAWVIPTYVTDADRLVSPRGNAALGLACHNQMFLLHRDGRSGMITSTIVHELGHVLGLPHEEGTWMDAQGTAWGIPQDSRTWNLDQLEHLLFWRDVGEDAPPAYEHGDRG